MRLWLDRLYLASGILAGIFLVGIAVAIIAQVVGRSLGFVIDSTETAGFCMAASTFLGLAYTLRSGSHIRVNLLIRHARGPLKRLIEIWCLAFTAAGCLYFTWWAVDFVYFSYVYNEISPGLMAVPFWIPRSGMALGLMIMTIAVIDELASVIRGQDPVYDGSEDQLFAAIDDEDPALREKP